MPNHSAVPGDAAKLKILGAGAVRFVIADVIDAFTRETGAAVDFTFGTVGAIRNRLESGESADILIVSRPMLALIEQSGLFAPASRTDLGRTPTGICVRAGAPLPDISTPETFKQTLLGARAVAYTDPKAGGTSGIFLTGLMERLGIADAVEKKAILCRNGDVVVEKVADGEADIGSTFISEIVPVKGVTSAGPLPPPIANATAYVAGISARANRGAAARKFVAMLTDPARHDHWVSAGFEPAGRRARV